MIKAFFLFVLIAYGSIACDNHFADSPQPGFLKLSMTVEAGKLKILPHDTLSVNIASIRLWRGKERRDWAVISDTNRVYNLFQLADGKTVQISNKEIMYLPPGNYTRLTLRILLQDTMMVLGGKKYKVQIPRDEYQIINLDQNFQIVTGEITDTKLIFNAEQSLTFQSGRYRLVPKFRLSL